jgi:hypothetical protein
VAIIAVVGLVASQWTPTIRAEAASTPIAQATLGDGAASHGQQCLDRIVRPAGWLDLCWAIDRAPDLHSNSAVCFLRSERGVVMYEWVGVPQGTTPRWSIGADFGG